MTRWLKWLYKILYLGSLASYRCWLILLRNAWRVSPTYKSPFRTVLNLQVLVTLLHALLLAK
jgi:hypothetical protein